MKIKILLLFFCLNIFADRIESFHSNIKINKDRTIDVSEEIEFYLNQPRSDILRIFPTDYSKYGLRYIVPFKVLDVKLNNKKVKYSVEKYENGYEVKIGDFTLFSDLSKSNPKTYTVEIKYKTDWQIGFFDDHDELYWNVTGNGWPYKIVQASAEIILPKGENNLDETFYSTLKSLLYGVTSYYGKYGSRFKAISNLSDNVASFKTRESLSAWEGLTVVISWPKGFIEEPPQKDNFLFYLNNNYDIAILFLVFLLVLIYFIIAYFKTRIKKDTVVPLFSPPEDMLPMECEYILTRNLNYKAFSASIIDMAVRGYLIIDYKKTTYILNRVEGVEVKEKVYAKLDEYLFATRTFLNSAPKNQLKIKNLNWKILEASFYYLSNFLKSKLDKYWDNNFEYWFFGFTPSLIVLFYIFIFSNEVLFSWVLVFVFIALNVKFFFLLREYTDEGKRLRSKIAGFKMFLSFTEKQRLKYIACPERTPQEYEAYLPYAIAFGIEKLWTRQFSSLFKMLEAKGAPYSPGWYNGYLPFRPRTFSSSFSRAVAFSAPKISSSRSSSARRSGSGRGGSSGGGGGFSGGGGGGGGGR